MSKLEVDSEERLLPEGVPHTVRGNNSSLSPDKDDKMAWDSAVSEKGDWV